MILQLNESQIDKMKLFKPVFIKVQDLTGVPWELTASIWYRESFSVAPPKTIGGSFQFDPPPDQHLIMYLLKSFTPLTADECLEYIKLGINNFQAGALLCACFLRYKVSFKLNIESPDVDIKYAIWSYNGRAYGSPDKSPYVMNGFDENHKDMRMFGTLPDGKGGRIQLRDTDGKLGIVDKRPGAYVVYKQLKSLEEEK